MKIGFTKTFKKKKKQKIRKGSLRKNKDDYYHTHRNWQFWFFSLFIYHPIHLPVFKYNLSRYAVPDFIMWLVMNLEVRKWNIRRILSLREIIRWEKKRRFSRGILFSFVFAQDHKKVKRNLMRAYVRTWKSIKIYKTRFFIVTVKEFD